MQNETKPQTFSVDPSNPPGPIQVGRINKAAAKLRSASYGTLILCGVKGGDEYTMQELGIGGKGGPERERGGELFAEIGEAYGWTVTKKNAAAIAKAILGKVPEAEAARPVRDERKTAEEEATTRAEYAERSAAQVEKQDDESAERDAQAARILSQRPPGAVALIVAELDEDASDLMSDYHSHRTTRTVAIGWRTGSRESFPQLRKAAAAFAETAHLAPGLDRWSTWYFTDPDEGQNVYRNRRRFELSDGRDTWETEAELREAIGAAIDEEHAAAAKQEQDGGARVCESGHFLHLYGFDEPHRESAEHRENYSMGAGNYLKAGGSDSTGWRVVSLTLSDRGGVSCSRQIEDGFPKAAEAGGETIEGDGYEIQEATNKRGVFFLVVQSERVERAEFERLRASAKAAGGWYSRKWGKQAGGFGFDTTEAAQVWTRSEFGAVPENSGEVCHSCGLALDDQSASEGGWDPDADECISCGAHIGRNGPKPDGDDAPRLLAFDEENGYALIDDGDGGSVYTIRPEGSGVGNTFFHGAGFEFCRGAESPGDEVSERDLIEEADPGEDKRAAAVVRALAVVEAEQAENIREEDEAAGIPATHPDRLALERDNLGPLATAEEVERAAGLAHVVDLFDAKVSRLDFADLLAMLREMSGASVSDYAAGALLTVDDGPTLSLVDNGGEVGVELLDAVDGFGDFFPLAVSSGVLEPFEVVRQVLDSARRLGAGYPGQGGDAMAAHPLPSVEIGPRKWAPTLDMLADRAQTAAAELATALLADGDSIRGQRAATLGDVLAGLGKGCDAGATTSEAAGALVDAYDRKGYGVGEEVAALRDTLDPDLAEAAEGETCDGCGRGSLDCSREPCADVVADRGGPWEVTEHGGQWYAENVETGQRAQAGPVGGPRGNGRGTNYRDRAASMCDKRNAAALRLTAEHGEPRGSQAVALLRDISAARLEEMAARLAGQIVGKRRPLTQNWTARRGAQKDSQRADADRLERVEHALRACAWALRLGRLPGALGSSLTKKALGALCEAHGLKGRQVEAARVLLHLVEEWTAKRPGAEEQAAAVAAREAEDALRALTDRARTFKVPGFFPTPPRVCAEVVGLLELEGGESVLEPSAGIGSLADAVRGAMVGGSLTVVEIAPPLVEILEAKGYGGEGGPRLVSADFLALGSIEGEPEPAGLFDRIAMNPPFERGADVVHVRAALGRLAPGGILVAVMSPKGAAAVEEEYGAERYPLPAGSFTGAEAFRQTGVSADLVRFWG